MLSWNWVYEEINRRRQITINLCAFFQPYWSEFAWMRCMVLAWTLSFQCRRHSGRVGSYVVMHMKSAIYTK